MKIIRFSIKHAKTYKFIFLIYFISSLFNICLTTTLPYISGSFIDNLLSESNMGIIYRYAAIYISIALLQLILQYIIMRSQTNISTNASMKVNRDAIEHLQHVPTSFYNDKDISSLNQRIYTDSSAVINFSLETLVNFTTNFIALIYTLYLVININKYTTFIIIFCSILYIAQYIFTKKKYYLDSTEFKEKQTKLYSSLFEQLSKIKFIKMFNVFDVFKDRLQNSYDTFYKAVFGFQKTAFMFQGSQILVTSVSKSVLLIFAGIQFLKGNITIGMFSILISYYAMVLSYVGYYLQFGKSYIPALVSYKRLSDLFEIDEEPNGKENIDKITDIKIQDLHFSYGDKIILKGITYTFTKNNIYCIYGPNGIGKSTMIDIILGLNTDNYLGEIKYNNVSKNQLDMYKIREQLISYVPQEVLYYHDTIYNNLTIGTDNNNRNMIEEIANDFNLTDANRKEKLKLDYIISEKGDNLSGGELQKISLIRSFLKNADIFVYDEPTTSLDYASKKYFLQKLNDFKRNSIIIIITHDEDLKHFCDTIIDFESINRSDEELGFSATGNP